MHGMLCPWRQRQVALLCHCLSISFRSLFPLYSDKVPRPSLTGSHLAPTHIHTQFSLSIRFTTPPLLAVSIPQPSSQNWSRTGNKHSVATFVFSNFKFQWPHHEPVSVECSGLNSEVSWKTHVLSAMFHPFHHFQARERGHLHIADFIVHAHRFQVCGPLQAAQLTEGLPVCSSVLVCSLSLIWSTPLACKTPSQTWQGVWRARACSFLLNISGCKSGVHRILIDHLD